MTLLPTSCLRLDPAWESHMSTQMVQEDEYLPPVLTIRGRLDMWKGYMRRLSLNAFITSSVVSGSPSWLRRGAAEILRKDLDVGITALQTVFGGKHLSAPTRMSSRSSSSGGLFVCTMNALVPRPIVYPRHNLLWWISPRLIEARTSTKGLVGSASLI